eukprot:CAMPEP_0170516262 /NCGR_PEP_ID=MMETSP0209-20121228/2524_1 /TAXON_ID=665100 ORGANISM="Litonotus pictus, Strain P1" /NCGR_SAMPLE_ID=MMETSP0209 /ASSEMBLY_ACC=CAM_ASM_000301 /LENGTH=288 /DNA_ID=CAMNT_0010801081 /DNA_START=272 /DNA_END=1139 /DNA_ORIENTATION=-
MTLLDDIGPIIKSSKNIEAYLESDTITQSSGDILTIDDWSEENDLKLNPEDNKKKHFIERLRQIRNQKADQVKQIVDLHKFFELLQKDSYNGTNLNASNRNDCKHNDKEVGNPEKNTLSIVEEEDEMKEKENEKSRDKEKEQEDCNENSKLRLIDKPEDYGEESLVWARSYEDETKVLENKAVEGNEEKEKKRRESQEKKEKRKSSTQKDGNSKMNSNNSSIFGKNSALSNVLVKRFYYNFLKSHDSIKRKFRIFGLMIILFGIASSTPKGSTFTTTSAGSILFSIAL